jgi:hypothetical protein
VDVQRHPQPSEEEEVVREQGQVSPFPSASSPSPPPSSPFPSPLPYHPPLTTQTKTKTHPPHPYLQTTSLKTTAKGWFSERNRFASCRTLGVDSHVESVAAKKKQFEGKTILTTDQPRLLFGAL